LSLLQTKTTWLRIIGFGKVSHLIINEKRTACGHDVNGELKELKMSKRCATCSNLEKQYLLYNLRNIEID